MIRQMIHIITTIIKETFEFIVLHNFLRIFCFLFIENDLKK